MTISRLWYASFPAQQLPLTRLLDKPGLIVKNAFGVFGGGNTLSQSTDTVGRTHFAQYNRINMGACAVSCLPIMTTVTDCCFVSGFDQRSYAIETVAPANPVSDTIQIQTSSFGRRSDRVGNQRA